jgi:hypothetical protein
MVEVPLGFSFAESDDGGFTIWKKAADGAVTELKMVADDVYSLKAAIDLWTDRKMSSYQVASGAVQPIVAHAIARVGLWPDAVQENVLLIVDGQSGGRMTLSVPLSVARKIVLELPNLLARMRAAENPTKQ